ncbi:hypothetical protein BOTBODRAFT_76989, partial [Botryobasidium botryosum FD-172 SS1]
TDRLIEYLTDNPVFRIKFFSDSSRDANGAGHHRLVAMEAKIHQHATLASYIFKENCDPVYAVRYRDDPSAMATSVCSRITRLKAGYRGFLKELRAAGAGLKPEDVTPGSSIANKIGTSRWSWWDDLHAFWMEPPNYNPISVSNSTSGHDHEA